MMCDCLSKFNDVLKAKNTKLSTGFFLSHDLGTADLLPIIQTEKLDNSKRGRPATVIPTFCPFCGKKYPRVDDEPPVAK